MPEGDAVWRTARRLDRALAGTTLTRTDFRVPAIATADLSGRPVLGTLTHGKHLLTRIGQDWTLHTHLRMDGSWVALRPGQRWPRPAHTARVVLATDGAEAVGFLLGVVELLPRTAERQALSHLGPDLLGEQWDDAAESEAVRRLLTHPDETVFDALRDQTSLAGIGTIWAAETCFAMGVHPTTPVAQVKNLTRMVRVARLKLEQSIGSRGPAPMAVYGRGRAACRRCGTPVQRIQLGGDARPRWAYLCPSCQPESR